MYYRIKYLRLTFCLCCLLSAPRTVLAQQHISTNTIWSTNQILSQSVIVDPGATLKVMAGVVVQPVFLDVNGDSVGDVSIEIRGKLVVDGATNNRVLFRPYENTTNKKYWQGIIINSTQKNDSLQYFEIRNAFRGLNITSRSVVTGAIVRNSSQYGIDVASDSVVLQDVAVVGSDNNGIDVSALNTTISWASIDSCGGVGLNNNASGATDLSNSIISHSRGSGIFNLDGNLSAYNCSISNNGRYGIVNSSGNFNMSYSDVASNGWDGVLMEGNGNNQLSYSSIVSNLGSGVEITEWRQSVDGGAFSKEGNPSVRVNNSNIFGNALTTVRDTSDYPGAIFQDWGNHDIPPNTTGPTVESPIGWVYRVAFEYGNAGNSGSHEFIILSGTGTELMRLTVTPTSPFWGNFAEDSLRYNSTDKYTIVIGAARTTSSLTSVRNWRCRLALNRYNVTNNVNDPVQSDFTSNYWGQITGVDTLIHYVQNPNINYSGYQVSEILNAHSNVISGKSISISNPVTGLSYQADMNLSVIWQTKGFIASVNIAVSTDLGSAWSSIAKNVTNNGTYNWHNNLSSGTTAYLRISDSYQESVNLQVGPFFVVENTTPVMNLSAHTLDFDSTSTARPFDIINTGHGTLNWNVTSREPWLSFSNSSGSTSGRATDTAIASRGGLNPGNYSGKINITSNGGNDSVIVTMRVPNPYSKISVTTLYFDSVTTSLPITLTNTGGGRITWSANPNRSWISVNPSSGNFSNQSLISISVARSNLPPGSYDGSVVITTNAGNFLVSIGMSVAASLSQVSLVLPRTGDTNVPASVMLRWNSLAGATAYQVQVSSDSSFNTIAVNDSTVADTVRNIGPLGALTKYYWHVRARFGSVFSLWSATWSFTTVVAAPTAPTLAAPADSAINLPLNTTVSWNAVTGATAYHLQVSTSSSFSTNIVDDTTLSAPTKVIGPLSLASTYYWKVRAKNAGGFGAFSAVRSFKTIRTTAVEQLGSGIPTVYSLSQNYPNPFNPSTTIQFAIVKGCHVTLKVFDLLGREVATMVSQELGAGYFTVRWQADVPSGTYVYRLQAGEYLETKKMLLLR